MEAVDYLAHGKPHAFQEPAEQADRNRKEPGAKPLPPAVSLECPLLTKFIMPVTKGNVFQRPKSVFPEPQES